jgi:hypothetical protein
VSRMDPTANLAEQRVLVRRIVDDRACDADRERLCELTEALDEWMTSGGHMPKQWLKYMVGV